MKMSKAMQSALAAVKRMKRGDRKIAAAEVRKAMNVEAALRRRRERDDEEDDENDQGERLH